VASGTATDQPVALLSTSLAGTGVKPPESPLLASLDVLR